MKSTKSRRVAQEAKRKAQQQQQQRLLLIIGGAVVVVAIIAVVVLATRGNTSTSSTQNTGSISSAEVASMRDPSSSPCVGVKDPETPVPAGGSKKQWTAPEQVIDVNHVYCAIIKTDKGRVVAELYPKSAPKNVNNFVFLAQQGFYDGLTWHRVLSGFMAQTGDPTGTGSGGPGYDNIPLEIDPNLKYDMAGRIGVARTGDPNSAGSQFFVMFNAYPGLDPNPATGNDGYTIIGQVVEGQPVVNAIKLRDPEQNPTGSGDPLVSVRVVDLTATK